MNILYFHNSIPEYREKLFLKLAEKNKNLTFVFTDFSYSKKIYNTEVENDVLNKIRYEILSEGFSAFKEIKKILQKHKPEIVILPALDTFREFLIARYILRLVNNSECRILYFWEKWEAPKEYITYRKKIKNGIQSIAAKVIFKNVDVFLSPGKKTSEYLEKRGAKKDNIIFFHDVSSVEICETFSLKEEYKIPNTDKIFLYYGRIIKRKGLDLLIDALDKSMYKDHIWLFVAGEGEYKTFCEELAKKNSSIHIIFVGFISPQYKYQYFSQSDIFVLPSIALGGTIEAWGLTINEAIQTNNFIICSDVVGASYELVSEANGIVFKQGSIEELTKAINVAYEFQKGKEFYAYNSMLKESYTYENMCEDFQRAFRKAEKINV